MSQANPTESSTDSMDPKSNRIITTATDADKRIITFDPEAHTFYSIQHKDLVTEKKNSRQNLQMSRSATTVDMDPSTNSANSAAFTRSAPLSRKDWAARKASFLSTTEGSASAEQRIVKSTDIAGVASMRSKYKELEISLPSPADDGPMMDDLESGGSSSAKEDDDATTSETTAQNTKLNAANNTNVITNSHKTNSTPRSGTSMNLSNSLDLAKQRSVAPKLKKKSIAFAMNNESHSEEGVDSTSNNGKKLKDKKNKKGICKNSASSSIASGISNQFSNFIPFNQNNYGSTSTRTSAAQSQIHPHDSISQYNPPSVVSGYTDLNKNRGVCKSSTHCYLIFVAILCNVISLFYMVYIPLQVNYRYESFTFLKNHIEKAELRKKEMSNWEKPHASEIIAELVRGYEMIAPYHGCNGSYGCSEGHKGLLGSIPATLSSILINVCDLAFMLVLGAVAYMICSKRFEEQPKSKSGLFLAQVVSSWFYLFFIIVVNVVALNMIKPQHDALEKNLQRLDGVKGYDEQLMDTYQYCRKSVRAGYKEDARNAHWLHFEILRYVQLAREDTPMLYRHLGFAYVQRGLLFFTYLMLYSLLVFCSHRALRKFKRGQKELKERTRNEQLQAQAIKNAMLSHNTAFFLNAYSPRKSDDNAFNGQGGFGWGGFQNPLLAGQNPIVSAQQQALVAAQQQQHRIIQHHMQNQRQNSSQPIAPQRAIIVSHILNKKEKPTASDSAVKDPAPAGMPEEVVKVKKSKKKVKRAEKDLVATDIEAGHVTPSV